MKNQLVVQFGSQFLFLLGVLLLFIDLLKF